MNRLIGLLDARENAINEHGRVLLVHRAAWNAYAVEGDWDQEHPTYAAAREANEARIASQATATLADEHAREAAWPMILLAQAFDRDPTSTNLRALIAACDALREENT